MKQTWFYILCLIIISLTTLDAQQVSIESRLDTNVIVMGDQTKLNVDIEYPKNQDIKYNIHKDTIIKLIEVVDWKIDTIADNSNNYHFKISYTITSFDSGYYAIPPEILTLLGDTIAESKPLIMGVTMLAVDTTQQKIFDIKTPIEAPWTFSEFIDEYLSYIIIGILIILLIISIIWHVKKRRKKPKKPSKPIVPKEAAHIIALRDLEILKDKKLWQNNRVKLYYIELTNIVRTYIENRFKIMALEQTSSEILDSFYNLDYLTEDQILLLQQILKTADLAKFAKVKPMTNENDLSLKNAFIFIEQTKITEPKEKKEVENDA